MVPRPPRRRLQSLVRAYAGAALDDSVRAERAHLHPLRAWKPGKFLPARRSPIPLTRSLSAPGPRRLELRRSSAVRGARRCETNHARGDAGRVAEREPRILAHALAH